jgi:hypothetical protein
MRCLVVLALATVFAVQQAISATQQQNSIPAPSRTEAMYRAASAQAEAKFHYIATNGAKQHPDPAPTVLTEREINAYLSSGNVDLPKGLSHLRLSGNAGTVSGSVLVDFDTVTAGNRSSHPLLSLFSGTHQVEVIATARGTAGQGQVHINSVALDGIPVPRMALQFFVDRYIKPKHPNLGMDSQILLPDRIDTATISSHALTVIQK